MIWGSISGASSSGPPFARSMMRLKVSGRMTWPQSEFDLEGLEIVLERHQLLAAGRFVVAVHHGAFFASQRLGGRDVGGDHIILDQLVRIERSRAATDRIRPFSFEHDAAFGEVRSNGLRFCRAA